jgi:predicted transcriptional regulator
MAEYTKAAKSEQRLHFFETLFSDDEGYLCTATSDPRAPKLTFAQQYFEWPREAKRAENFFLRVERENNVYFCVNLLSKKERKKENCLPTDLLWADLDAVNPDVIDDYPPPILLRSSPGRWQGIWRMTTKIPPFQAEDYSRRLAYHLGADKSGWDLGQLLRVPLTVNWKYNTPVQVELQRLSEIRAEPAIFELLKVDVGLQLEAHEPDMPSVDKIFDADQVIFKYGPLLRQTAFSALFTQDPEEGADWSGIMWRLLHQCFKVGMSTEETFAVALDAKCNKYARDGRPLEHLWREVNKAGLEYQHVDGSVNLVEMPHLVDENDPRITKTFVDTYREWATEATDAVADFHDISMLVVLSAIVSSSVKLETSAGMITPNIWGIILGDSTVTRKTTAMSMAMGFLLTIDPTLVVATDGTGEGLLSALSERPNRSSMYYKDEVSGLFDSMTKKDYLAALQETFTALYDVPSIISRRLRKETIVIESPAFVILCGGVTSKVFAATDETFVLSGFLPRFIVVSGNATPEDRRALTAPTVIDHTKRSAILNTIADIYEAYATDVKQKIGGQTVLMPPRYVARMTEDAWKLNAEIEFTMVSAGYDSVVPDLALPTMDRLARSTLKIAIILAAIRQKPVDGTILIEEHDLLNAATYTQRWGRFSIEMMLNAGKGRHEKHLDKIVQFIADRPGSMRSTLMKRFTLDSKTATAILQTLEERGLIRKEQRGRGFAYWIT